MTKYERWFMFASSGTIAFLGALWILSFTMFEFVSGLVWLGLPMWGAQLVATTIAYPIVWACCTLFGFKWGTFWYARAANRPRCESVFHRFEKGGAR